MLWLILGLLIGVGGFWLATRGNLNARWYEWLLAILAVLLALFAIQNYTASLAENEPRAAGLLLAMFGLLALILGIVTGVLVWLRKRPASLISES